MKSVILISGDARDCVVEDLLREGAKPFVLRGLSTCTTSFYKNDPKLNSFGAYMESLQNKKPTYNVVVAT